MNRALFFVNGMDREAKAGRDPETWLAAQLARLKYAIDGGFAKDVHFRYAQRLENRVKKAGAIATSAHCQICERLIQANTGVIAHHGYQRPGQGWQTASCFGARYVAYEVGHDALDAYIPWVQGMREHRVALLTKLINDPPEKMVAIDDVVTRIGRMRKVDKKVTEYPRPVGFVPFTERPAYGPRDYARMWFNRRTELEHEIESMTREIDRAAKRRAAWKKPV